MTGSDYVERWAGDAVLGGTGVRAILGNCAGSAYVPALAERIAARQGERPKEIIFDPESPTPLTLYWQFHGLIDESQALLKPAEVSTAQQAGQRAMNAIPDMGRLAAELVGLFRETGGLARQLLS
jgi:hypothetical protein